MKSSASLHHAEFVKRLVAFALDYLIIGAYIVALAVTTLGIFKGLEFVGRAVAIPENRVIRKIPALANRTYLYSSY